MHPDTTSEAGSEPRERKLGIPLIAGAVLTVAAGLVALTLGRPEPPTFAPSPIGADSAGISLVGPVTKTLDATTPDRWIHFSFQAGSVVENPGPTDWDLAVRRFQVIANGGQGFFGTAGLQALGDIPFDSVIHVPTGGYHQTVAAGDSINEGVREWYDYSFLSHLLTPRRTTYAARTADGRYAKFEVVGYYCPGGIPGCMTFRYVYQGDGSTRVGTPRPPDPVANE